MPFDATPFDGLNQGLVERLSWSGIVPVSSDVLEAHKAAEVAKHPDQRERILFAVLFVSLAIGYSVAGSVVCSDPRFSVLLQIPLTFVWGAVIAFQLLMSRMVVLGCVKVKGPARWRERPYVGQSVPEPILALARDTLVPGSLLVIGELIQDRVVLDPYLMLCEGNDRVCPGIWDGETIIAMAGRREP